MLTNMNVIRRRPHVFPSTVSPSLLRSPVMNGTSFCPTTTEKLGLEEQSRPWGLHPSAHGPEEPMPVSPWLYGGSASTVSLPAEPQGWDLLSESQKWQRAKIIHSPWVAALGSTGQEQRDQLAPSIPPPRATYLPDKDNHLSSTTSASLSVSPVKSPSFISLSSLREPTVTFRAALLLCSWIWASGFAIFSSLQWNKSALRGNPQTIVLHSPRKFNSCQLCYLEDPSCSNRRSCLQVVTYIIYYFYHNEWESAMESCLSAAPRGPSLLCGLWAVLETPNCY